MYKLFPLPYLYQDLEPFIDTHTNGLHYNKHTKNYLTKLNELLIKNNYDYRYNLVELLYHINEFKNSDQDDILFNLGAVLNHELYFNSMSSKKNQKLEGKLKEDIIKQYGSLDAFYKKFKDEAMKLKGSGYTFLVLKDNKLDIINLSNQNTPLLYGYIPLLNIDLWEHAYYLNYENDKSKYIDNFIEIIDFNNANKIYNKLNVTKNI